MSSCLLVWSLDPLHKRLIQLTIKYKECQVHKDLKKIPEISINGLKQTTTLTSNEKPQIHVSTDFPLTQKTLTKQLRYLPTSQKIVPSFLPF